VGSIRNAALEYVSVGLAVYPAHKDKTPAIRGWNKGLTDPEAVEKHFADDAELAVGIATEPSRLVVLDIDIKSGGDQSWQRLCSEVGSEVFDDCPVVRTPSGGFHVYFAAPDRTVGNAAGRVFGPGIDIRARGGGVIAPPSRRGETAYEWRTPSGSLECFNPPRLPDVLLRRIRDVQARRAATVALPHDLFEGQRNEGLTRWAGRLRRIGCSYEEIEANLLQRNIERCKPPLEASEVRVIANSVARYEPGRDGLAWQKAWLPRVKTLRQTKIVAFLAILRECTTGPLSPALEFAERETGLLKNHYAEGRKRLEELGAITVQHRGRTQAPIIELCFPPDEINRQ
jgi:hypothetical protein